MPSQNPSADGKYHFPPYGDQNDQLFAELIDREVSRDFDEEISYHEELSCANAEQQETLGGQSRDYTPS